MGDEDARARRERAEALRRQIAGEKAGASERAPGSPREFVEEKMRELDEVDEQEREDEDGER